MYNPYSQNSHQRYCKPECRQSIPWWSSIFLLRLHLWIARLYTDNQNLAVPESCLRISQPIHQSPSAMTSLFYRHTSKYYNTPSDNNRLFLSHCKRSVQVLIPVFLTILPYGNIPYQTQPDKKPCILSFY